MASAPDQQPVPPVLDEEARQLQLLQFKTDLRKQIAEDQKAVSEAQAPATPATDFKPLEGTVDIGEKVGVMADLLAHSVLRKGARSVVGDLHRELPAGARVLVVEDRALLAADWPYRIVAEPLTHHFHALCSIVRQIHDAVTGLAAKGTEAPQPAPHPSQTEFSENLHISYLQTWGMRELTVAGVAGLGAAGLGLAGMGPATLGVAGASALVGNLATLVGMFKTDYSVANRDVTIGGTTLVAAIVQELRSAPPGTQVSVENFRTLQDSALLRRFYGAWSLRGALKSLQEQLSDDHDLAYEDKLQETRWAERKDAASAYTQALAQVTEPAVLAGLEARLEALDAEIRTSVRQMRPVRSLVATASEVGANFDAFATAVTTPPKEGAYSPLVAAVLRERLHTESGPTHVLFVAAEAAGGEVITKHSAFGGSGDMGFLGGCQVSWLLYDIKQDATVAGGTEPLLARLDYRLDGKEAPVRAIDFKLD